MVTCKFRCVRNSAPDNWPDANCRVVRLVPFYDPDDETNKSWSEATPSGAIEMTITNPAAFEQFEVDAEYYIDFRKV